MGYFSDSDEEYVDEDYEAFPVMSSNTFINPFTTTTRCSIEVVKVDGDVIALLTSGPPFHRVGDYMKLKDDQTRKPMGLAYVIGTNDSTTNKKSGVVPDEELEYYVYK